MTPAKIALKRATAEMIKGADGLVEAADFCRVGKTVLGDNQSPNKPDSFVALDVIADLEPLARARDGWPHVTSALCKLMGGTFVLLPERSATASDVFHLLATLSKEASDTTGILCLALADGQISDDEARNAICEIDGLIRVSAEMRALLQSILQGER